ncbi:phosphotransferase [Paracoccus aminophilus]|uniref:Aminoglycoside phosphotransferase domain-containing protein n=1 Tax=Paracoccus aminophilus JCM 7686 TaxID=1367847 RepID=S5XLJ1_PARAH|nr:phosphotransferase [Paracoccus aminophilus]AGT08059.1 hypothetical protein JCM7686_0950 [Paracoccus aminophilus JCM 7686]
MSPLPPATIGGGLLPDLPDLEGLVVTEVLRDRPDHAVFAVIWRDRPYFLKLFRNRDAADLVRETVKTLDRAAEALGQAENAVVKLRLALPEAGIILLDPVKGVQLTNAIAIATLPRRKMLIARAGGWLSTLTATRERGVFGPGFWLKGLEDRADRLDPDADAALIARHLERMRELAQDLRGADVERAMTHGDFTPDNFYLDGARLVGIDMQRGGQMAVVRDVGRFLVWLQSRRSEMPEVTRHGVSASDYAALRFVPGLLGGDQEPVLRFMMGEIMAAYYIDARGKVLRRMMLAGAMRRWQEEFG